MTNALHEAASAGDLETVRALLAHSDIDGEDERGRTPLMSAVKAGHSQIAACLLEHGASPNGQMPVGGDTLLTSAIRNGQKEIVRLLLKHGSDVTLRDQLGMTPLLFAVEKTRTSSVSALIEAGADIDAIDDSGNTALTLAAQRGYTEVVEVLLQVGAKERIGSGTPKFQALTWTAFNSHAKLFKMLIHAHGRPVAPDIFVQRFARENPEIAAFLRSFDPADLP